MYKSPYPGSPMHKPVTDVWFQEQVTVPFGIGRARHELLGHCILLALVDGRLVRRVNVCAWQALID